MFRNLKRLNIIVRIGLTVDRRIRSAQVEWNGFGLMDLRLDVLHLCSNTSMATQTAGFLCVFTQPAITSDPADETFRIESKEAHKSRRTFLEGASISILSHEHYRLVKDTNPTSTDGNSSQSMQAAAQFLDLYELDDIEPLLTGRAIIAEGGDGPLEVHSFTYKSLR